MFNKIFTTCLNIGFSELEDSWKTYSTLSVTEGCIRLQPVTKVNIRAFFQWKNQDGRGSCLSVINVAEGNDPIERCNTHKQWTDDASNMARNAMPKSLTEKMEFCQTTQFIIDENVSQMRNVTGATDSIMGVQN